MPGLVLGEFDDHDAADDDDDDEMMMLWTTLVLLQTYASARGRRADAHRLIAKSASSPKLDGKGF